MDYTINNRQLMIGLYVFFYVHRLIPSDIYEKKVEKPGDVVPRCRSDGTEIGCDGGWYGS